MRLKFLSFVLILPLFVFVGAGCSALKQGQNNAVVEPQGNILFVGEGCPHCEKVEEFIDQNKVKDKVSFVMLEVYKNKDNAALMAKKAGLCGIPLTGMGVPFLWDGSKCLVGDIDIINFFQEKIK
ncbi:MAG: hypothetical protein UT86_C0001G0065 [Candidatus Magasanikbacteria bacterium GW2011_GWC2_40_17]|uniref:Uncharacterized protein n=1 Tax=Candidatus Magasanikbacteria bacterium GW2011_GWA2_42_32 TaxID=1619039 RepID=A0A0G1A8R5_9BACT|nr:MAG: hypothetical protein UT86_C0001G0065 [Candidatus Magasanikbacteria bacterium GW2011_GWC2_40_17]KKS57425.1 MAG: hypothetical protein UV20_C0001G0065 [Candidatus Magasanikbacteria bacterium GW2011_GWA2_42_32]OGH85582.1 MAG: hypothetical protein A2294_01745 [Candidatus Magasanikbacteria bacterium RIFOXYB2_FULL_38_10]